MIADFESIILYAWLLNCTLPNGRFEFRQMIVYMIAICNYYAFALDNQGVQNFKTLYNPKNADKCMIERQIS